MSCRRSGFEPTSPLALSAEVRQLELDRALLDILPQSLQDQWYKYLPAGQIDADVQLAYDGQTWRPEVSVQCLNVSFTHHKFPYRLDHGQGTLELKDDLLKVNLTAYGGSQPVRLAAEVAHPLSGPTGWFEAKGDDIQLDEALIAALPEKPREVVRSLDPRGTVELLPADVARSARRTDAPASPAGAEPLLDPLQQVSLSVDATSAACWRCSTATGPSGTSTASNNTARVTCEGPSDARPSRATNWC